MKNLMKTGKADRSNGAPGIGERVVKAALGCFFVLVSGCSVISFVDLATAGQEEKQKTLGERVAKFHRELYWGSGTGFVEYIEASKRTELTRQLRQAQALEKLVDLEVRGIEFDEANADRADVDVKVRYYSKSSLNVTERFEKETWEYYRMRGGWFLMSREIAPMAPVG